MNSAKSTLKSTGLIGGSQVINMAIGIIRSKAIALILGPAGTGFIGALQSATALTQQLAGLGIGSSAVRDIAQAHASGDKESLQLTVSAQRMAVIVTGIFGMLLTLVLAPQLSQFTFDTKEYTTAIRLIAIAVFFNIIQGGQASVIQGTRQIRKLAELSIIGGLLSTVVSIPFIYALGLKGVAPYIVVVAFSQYIVTFYYARQLNIRSTWLSLQLFWEKTRGMVKLGLAFMLGGLATAATTYLIRAYLIKDFELSGAGLYQAAFGISGIYINVVLQAMGQDFYPRLTAVAFQPEKEIALINEQTEIGMLLAAPGLLLTLALAPLVIPLLYTSEYMEAYPLLQWMILGVFMRTISWPMGFLFISRAKGNIFFITQVVANLIHLAFLLILIQYLGLLGAGIAFFGLYSLHVIYMYVLIHRENGYQWSLSNLQIIGSLILVFALAFVILSYTSQWLGSSIVCLMAAGIGYFTLRKMMEIMEVESIQDVIILVKKKLRK